MPTRRLTDECVLGLFDAFALSEMHDGGSLELKTYQASPAAGTSSTTIVKRFGGGRWPSAVLAQRDHFLEIAPRLDVTVIVPVSCKKSRFSWSPTVLEQWRDAQCSCGCAAGGTIRELYPDLIDQLLDTEDADRLSTRWVMWACPKKPSKHAALFGTADWLDAGKLYCRTCRSDETFRAAHKPGTLMASSAPSSKTEESVVAALRQLLSGERVLTKRAVALRAVDHPRVGRAITPDILLWDRRVAIEIDGGDGNSPRYSDHDTDEGAVVDAARDRALARLKISTIRVRHPDALRLVRSPATILSTRSDSGRVIAELIVAELSRVAEGAMEVSEYLQGMR